MTADMTLGAVGAPPISQSSVATRLRCDGIFTNHFTISFLPSPKVEEFSKIGRHWAKLQKKKGLVFGLRYFLCV